jgi:hypothetical protein
MVRPNLDCQEQSGEDSGGSRELPSIAKTGWKVVLIFFMARQLCADDGTAGKRIQVHPSS